MYHLETPRGRVKLFFFFFFERGMLAWAPVSPFCCCERSQQNRCANVFLGSGTGKPFLPCRAGRLQFCIQVGKGGERQAVAVPLQSTFHLRFPSCAMWSKEGWFFSLNAPKRENQHTKRNPTNAVVSRHSGPVDIYRL